jgi:hypothetical protein
MNMQPVHLYAALIDVLAYKERLERDRSQGVLDFQNQLSSALRVFDGLNEAIFKAQAISDTIIMTCSEHHDFPQFLDILRQVFISFLEQCLFIRGGIAYSRHFNNNRLTYSHAVARAYELENSIANFPRIVIDSNIIQMYDSGKGLPSIRGKDLVVEENGVHFLNILTDSNWIPVYTLVRNLYNSDKKQLLNKDSAFSKHVRFQRYLFSSPYKKAKYQEYIDSAQML